MTKEKIKIIRSLPERYVEDGTEVWEVGAAWVAVNPLLPPIKKSNGEDAWEEITPKYESS